MGSNVRPVFFNARTARFVTSDGNELDLAATRVLHPDGLLEIGGGTCTVTTQTTVGAAGGATALPATPTGYIQIYLNGSSTKYIIPYYAQA